MFEISPLLFGVIPTITILTQLLKKRVPNPSENAWLIAIALGFASAALLSDSLWQWQIIEGITVGLVAMGAYDTTKKVGEKLTKKKKK